MGFKTNIYHPLMENKNYAPSPALATINIAYSLRTHDPASSVRRRQEASLQFSLPRPNNPSPKHSPSTSAVEVQETAFNDGSLKYGKSQTLKEAVFNRLRIPIYRRSRRPKWLQLPNTDEQEEHPQSPPQAPREPEHRQNKTALHSRKQPTPLRAKQLKTSSSEEGGLERAWKQSGLGKGQMVDCEKMNTIVRVLLERAKASEKIYFKQMDEARDIQILRRKNNNISNPIQTFVKRPFAIKKLFSPPRLVSQEKDAVLQQTIDRDQFDAWQNSDLFGSNRNGIVEYTKQYVNPETSNGHEEKPGHIFQSKKRRRLIIREKK